MAPVTSPDIQKWNDHDNNDHSWATMWMQQSESSFLFWWKCDENWDVCSKLALYLVFWQINTANHYAQYFVGHIEALVFVLAFVCICVYWMHCVLLFIPVFMFCIHGNVYFKSCNKMRGWKLYLSAPHGELSFNFDILLLIFKCIHFVTMCVKVSASTCLECSTPDLWSVL